MTSYNKVLEKYGHLMGQWQLKITYYGGLVEVKLEDERLVGIEWQATNDNSQALRRDAIFSIGVDRDGDFEVLCLRGYQGPHPCRLNILNDSCFNVTCCDSESHCHPTGDDEEFEELFQIVGGNGESGIDKDLQRIKFLEIKRYDNTFDLKRLQLPSPPLLKPVINPGLFQGTYAGHGREVIALTYEQEGLFVKAIKISGDTNIPYGEVTFNADLRYSMVLREYEQSTTQLLTQMSKIPTAVPPQEVHLQPFVIPSDCEVDGYLNDLPNQCIARFSGFAQEANYGHTNPSFTEGHWIIFNEYLFAFLFLESASISVYHRVKNDF